MLPATADPLTYCQGLYHLVPAQRLAFILDQTGRQSDRVRRLPAAAVVWLVIGMALWPELSIPQVWRRLHPATDAPEPTDGAFAAARQRLGVAPMRQLFLQTARPMATPATAGAVYHGWRLMGLDGTVLDLPDTPGNARAFGRPRTARADGAFPQVHLLALCELGTHAVCGLTVKPCRRSEQKMAGPLIDGLGPGDLLLWDRGFFGYPLARRVVERGAHLLARVPASVHLPVEQRLADGSYLTRLTPGRAERQTGAADLPVRVIEYTHDDPRRPGCGERHRLLTDLLRPADLPAGDAPLVYHERWEEELALDEIKTHLNGRPVPLRSQTPAGIVQEVYGLVLAHYLIRRVMYEAAVGVREDPDRLSFTNTLRILQSRLPEAPRQPLPQWYEGLLREVRRQRRRPRRERWYPRVVKRKMANWDKKRPHHCRPPKPTKPFREAILILN